MTHPDHRHQWNVQDYLDGTRFISQATCTVCGRQVPSSLTDPVTDIRSRLTAAVPGWTFDYEADAGYLQLTSEPIYRTLSFGLVNIDLDANGEAVGIELLTLNPQDST